MNIENVFKVEPKIQPELIEMADTNTTFLRVKNTQICWSIIKGGNEEPVWTGRSDYALLTNDKDYFDYCNTQIKKPRDNEYLIIKVKKPDNYDETMAFIDELNKQQEAVRLALKEGREPKYTTNNPINSKDAAEYIDLDMIAADGYFGEVQD